MHDCLTVCFRVKNLFWMGCADRVAAGDSSTVSTTRNLSNNFAEMLLLLLCTPRAMVFVHRIVL